MVFTGGEINILWTLMLLILLKNCEEPVTATFLFETNNEYCPLKVE
jgi:hypothetical protein